MGGKTSIAWTEATWNPVRGCTIKSPGCFNCYAMLMAARYSNIVNGKPQAYHGVARMKNGKPQWTGKLKFVDKHLEDPIRWKNKPRMIFVNSMSDLFHERMPKEWIDKILMTMAWAPMHTYQVLTKRADVMRNYINICCPEKTHKRPSDGKMVTPPYMWFGTSVEDQAAAEERIPDLIETEAYIRWLSIEPMIGPVTLRPFLRDGKLPIEWVVIGGESIQMGQYRVMESKWALDLIAECKEFGVPVFMKQLGTSLAKQLEVKSAKGEELDEWPKEFQIREYPTVPKYEGEHDDPE
jgi:protein gp37